MSFHRPTRLELAMHEAGHAYAFAALTDNCPPSELGLVEEDGHHRGWSARRTILHPTGPYRDMPSPTRAELRRQAAAEIVISLAGPLAEFRHRHRGRDAGSLVMFMNLETFLVPGACDTDGDFQKIRDCLDRVECADGYAALRSLFDASEQITSDNWPSIRRLGRLLNGREYIEGDELGDWFETWPAKPSRCTPDIPYLQRQQPNGAKMELSRSVTEIGR